MLTAPPPPATPDMRLFLLGVIAAAIAAAIVAVIWDVRRNTRRE